MYIGYHTRNGVTNIFAIFVSSFIFIILQIFYISLSTSLFSVDVLSTLVSQSPHYKKILFVILWITRDSLNYNMRVTRALKSFDLRISLSLSLPLSSNYVHRVKISLYINHTNQGWRLIVGEIYFRRHLRHNVKVAVIYDYIKNKYSPRYVIMICGTALFTYRFVTKCVYFWPRSEGVGARVANNSSSYRINNRFRYVYTTNWSHAAWHSTVSPHVSSQFRLHD